MGTSAVKSFFEEHKDKEVVAGCTTYTKGTIAGYNEGFEMLIIVAPDMQSDNWCEAELIPGDYVAPEYLGKDYDFKYIPIEAIDEIQ